MKTDRIPLLENLLKNNQNDAFTLFALAKEYEKIFDAKKAIEIYLRLKTYQSDYVGLYFHLGKLYENQGLTSEALHVFEEGIAVSKKIGDFHAQSELQGAYQNLQIELDL